MSHRCCRANEASTCVTTQASPVELGTSCGPCPGGELKTAELAGALRWTSVATLGGPAASTASLSAAVLKLESFGRLSLIHHPNWLSGSLGTSASVTSAAWS